MLAGMMSELPNKNCWTLAEHAGDTSPDAMQHLLSAAVVDEDGLRDDLRDYVTEHLGSAGAVLVVDESGDLKKGTKTVGVQRQYTGTAGRIENSQVAVYLGYATAAGHAFLDTELYLPKSWTTDRDRCAEAGVPEDVGFATKPALAKKMIVRALDAGVAAAWVTGDEVYGADPVLRHELETRGVGYVLAIACDRRVSTTTGRIRADDLAAQVPRHGWQSHTTGDGAKGPREYDWAWIGIDPDTDDAAPGHRWLLIRRNRRSGELAYYHCYAPDPGPLNTLVAVAGRRWSIEESFQTGKGLCGLDQHQVRRWRSWRRWTILAMLAHAFLTVLAVTEPTPTTPTDTRQPTADKLIPLTRNEIRHLFAVLVIHPIRGIRHRLAWSTWRRRHQHRARTSHYQRRSHLTP
ncbi:IS701 family transposase [Nocardia asteroides]|nr:IS701 family transposase [Nocardia asteroides]